MSESENLNLVDNSLRGSSKGLYVIFTIGLLQQLLSIRLEKFELTVPWLMTVKMNAPENIYIFYCILSVFAAWRYYLVSGKELSELMSYSLVKFLNSYIGKKFIASFIHGQDEYFQSNAYQNKDKLWSTSVSGYSSGEPNSSSEWMVFEWKNSNQITLSYAYHESESESAVKALKYKKLWKLAPTYEASCGSLPYQEYTNTGGSYFASALVFITSLYSLKIALTDYKGLDYLLPIYLNLSMTLYVIAQVLVAN